MMRPLFLCSAASLLVACSSGTESAQFTPVQTAASASTTGAGGSSAGGGSSVAAASTGSTSGASVGAGGAISDAGTWDGGPIGGARPVTVHVPPTYHQGTPMPLIVMLHGLTASGALEEVYLNITAESDKRGFLYAHPDGTPDANLGIRFWNATNACCELDGKMIDDSAYLSAVLADIQTRFTVDPKRVFLMGHSNGGYMSYRMACDHADQIAAIASLAGAMWLDTSKCKPSGPVSVLEVHGTLDVLVAYNGGFNGLNQYPAAATTVLDWVGFDGCKPTADNSAPNLDMDSSIPGAETTVSRYETGCKAGGGAELWSIQGGSHLPVLSPSFIPKMIDFLYAHPKP